MSYRYLDLSGYAFTGKHAAIDLMREFSGFAVAHYQYEFNLLRIQGGIRDLETALVTDWSPVRSDAAIRHFRRLIRRFGSRNRLTRPASWFRATGWNYCDFFPGFVSRSHGYLAELVQATWSTDWPYPMAEMCAGELFLRKLMSKLRIPGAFDVQVALAAPEPDAFLAATRSYLRDLMASWVDGPKREPSVVDGPPVTDVVMHNTFEPFAPARALRYFDNARCMIIDRDPRDNYVAGLWYRPTRVPPEEFVRRYRLYRQIALRSIEPPEKVLRLQFEHLVRDYESSLQQIYDFLGIDEERHVAKQTYFVPEQSVKNIGIWRDHEDRQAVEYIGRELEEYCVDGV